MRQIVSNTRLARFLAIVGGIAMCSVSAIGGQTVITPPNNNYSPAQDVELGRKAAAEAEQQLPLLRDDGVTSLVTAIGQRLVDSLPRTLQHAEFRYSFQVVNVREINAFALPGGPMFLNRGMIEAARTEGEVAGVMAHELSHVALRHGTAQATKATKYEIGTLLGAILGSAIGGSVGSAVAQGTQFGLGTAFLRFSREFESQADLLGSHIMAAAGYDPLQMASMFKTIEKQGGSSGPQWLSDHPNPGDRDTAITREAKLVSVNNLRRDTRAFSQAQTRLRQMAAAPTTADASRKTAGAAPAPVANGNLDPDRVPAPSADYTVRTAGDLFRVSVPSNWRELSGNDAVTYAPDGAYGAGNQQSSFTHGMEIGVASNDRNDLRSATDALLTALARDHPNLGRPASYDRTTVGGRDGLHTVISNLAEATGRPERIALFTTLLGDGSLFYAFGVAPTDRFPGYEATFRRVVGSIQMVR
jgi:hypothetical protein